MYLLSEMSDATRNLEQPLPGTVIGSPTALQLSQAGPIPLTDQMWGWRSGSRSFLRSSSPIWVSGQTGLCETYPTHRVFLFRLLSLFSVSVGAFVKTWLPFVLLLGIILTVSLVFNLR